MSKLPPATSEEIAIQAGLNERYVREWLGAMATARVVEVERIGDIKALIRPGRGRRGPAAGWLAVAGAERATQPASPIPQPGQPSRAIGLPSRLRGHTLAAGVALLVLTAPLAGEAQQARKIHRIGSITSELPTTPPGQGPFWDRMRELGWVHGQNVVIEHRMFGADAARIPEITRELIGLGTDVFVVPNGSTAFLMQRVTRTIPIVTTSAGDLVASGLAASVARPGGNVTGLQVMQTELGGKHVSLLKEIVPGLSRVGALVGEAGFSEAKAPPTHPTVAYIRGIKSDALSLGLQPQVVVVAKGDEFEEAFSAFRVQRVQAIVVYSSSLTSSFRKTVSALALKHRLPTIGLDADWLSDGFLMSYGWDRQVNSRLAAEFVDRILRGAKAGDLPLQQPTTFRLGINLKIAKALSLPIPAALLVRADQVVE